MGNRQFKLLLAAITVALCALFLGTSAWPLSPDEHYLIQMNANVNVLADAVHMFGELLEKPAVNDSKWNLRMAECMASFETVSMTARKITPTPPFAKSHNTYIKAMDEIDAFRLLFTAGLNKKDLSLIAQADTHWILAGELLKQYALEVQELEGK